MVDQYHTLKLVLLSVAFISGSAVVCYEAAAMRSGYKIGELFWGWNWIKTVCLILMVNAFAGFFYVGSWKVAVMAVLGNMLIFPFMVDLFKSHTQIIALTGCVVSSAWLAILGLFY